MKNYCLIIFLIAFCNLSFAQENNSKIHRIRLSDVTFQRGVCGGTSPSFSFDDFHRLSPNSDLLSKDYSDFTLDHYDYHAEKFGSFSIGFQLRNKAGNGYRNHFLIRIGTSYFNLSSIDITRYNVTGGSIATLSSPQTNLVAWLDSTYEKVMGTVYEFDRGTLNAEVELKTSPLRRFNFYSGIGIRLGKSLKASTSTNYHESAYDEILFPQSSGYYMQQSYPRRVYVDAYEDFKNKSNFTYGAYIPIGVDFKLSKKNKILKLLHLTFEMQGEISKLKIPELKTYQVKTLGGSFGLKFGT